MAGTHAMIICRYISSGSLRPDSIWKQSCHIRILIIKWDGHLCGHLMFVMVYHILMKHQLYTEATPWIPLKTWNTVYPKKYAHGFCFAVLCCGYTLTDYPISIRLTSLALWQSNDCPSASKATLMNMDKYFMWIHYERLHNHNKAKHNKTVCIFLGIYCNVRVGTRGPSQ